MAWTREQIWAKGPALLVLVPWTPELRLSRSAGPSPPPAPTGLIAAWVGARVSGQMWFANDVPHPRTQFNSPNLRIVVHDFSGHPGQLQLSRELARRGHTVQHQFCQSFITGQGATIKRVGDPESFSIKGIALSQEFARYAPTRRLMQELKYGWLALRAILAAKPDIAVLSNLPIIPLAMVSAVLRIRHVPFVLWWQDIYSDAIGTVARRRLGRLGAVIASLVGRIEQGSAHRASAIVPISEGFLECLQNWGIDRDKTTVIPNWGALSELDRQSRNNPWSAAHGLDSFRVLMYAGTLGLKHDPSIIAELAQRVSDDCRVVVVSQGLGRQWLEEHCASNHRLVLLDYQAYDQLPNMLASADILVAILEKDASRYSVPSKVLNYMCAGRPVLALMPSDNAVARIVASARAGIVVHPESKDEVFAAADLLLSDRDLGILMGDNARSFAEDTFDIVKVGDTFEDVIMKSIAAISGKRGHRQRRGM